MSENGSHASCPYSCTVKQGDSYYRIAQRTGVRLRDLLEVNTNIPPAGLTVGDVSLIAATPRPRPRRTAQRPAAPVRPTGARWCRTTRRPPT